MGGIAVFESAKGAVARAVSLSCVVLFHATSVTAVTMPPQAEGKSALLRMVDARVNLQDSFQQASQARPGAVDAGLQAATSNSTAIGLAVLQRTQTTPGLEAKFSNLTGGPKSLQNKGGSLTPAAPGRTSEDIVRSFLLDNGGLYGLSSADVNDLVVLGDSAGGDSGLRMLRVEQQIDGRPVFQSESRFLLHPDGRLMKSVGLLVPHARAVAPQIDAAKILPPEQALKLLAATLGKTLDPATFVVAPDSNGRLQLSGTDDFVSGPVTARQVLFPLAPGFLVPAWSLVMFTSGNEDWYAVVDAETGALLWRKNIRNYASTHDARFRVYVQADGTTPADSPAPQSPNTVAPGSGTQFPAIAPTVVKMSDAMDVIASPNGWIDDCPGGVCTANQTQTLGNNAIACLDRKTPSNVCDSDATSILDGGGRPMGNPDVNGRNRDFLGTTPRDFEGGFLPPPQGGNPEAGQTATGDGNAGTLAVDSFRRGSVTHLFYLTNWYHDKLYRLGFDEAAGNFQTTNFSGMGVGNDRVLADAQDNSGTNNANFSTPPDGTSGRMQMYVFTGPTIDRDGSLDAEIVLHELTHGTSNRLVGNGAGLNWDPAGGMGEGWSDFYALSLLNNTQADDPNGRYAAGAYATYKLAGLAYLDNYVYGIRRFPYSTDHSVNPLTWADTDDVTNNLSGGIAPDPIGFNLNGGMEVHNIGEIWANTLWGVRARVIANPAGANGSVPTGNQTMLRLVTNGLKMTPIDPSFTEARDAILDADCAANACANEDSIWGGFADRGLGYGAKTPYNAATAFYASHMAVHESFALPFLDVVNVATDVTIDDSASNNNGAIDPGEAIKLTIKLTNPWRAASKAVAVATATLTTTTPGITIYDNTATYGAIAPQGSATGDTFTFTVDSSVLCGSAINFTLTTVYTVNSVVTTAATTFQLRVGGASGNDPVVTYTGDPNPDLAIPDNRPRGVMHQINITDDFVIADLDFRIDSITHTWDGDLTAMLRSPGGIGVDLVSLIGFVPNTNGGSSGDNITNMVINDDLPATAANDMTRLLPAGAPYTASFLPVFNSPWAPLFGYTQDPVGNLTRYDGTSTKGTWTALVSDQASGDIGTFNAWSILVTPVHFACTAFTTAAVNITATKTVSGSFGVGGTVTYTVTLTNIGTANQADNSGHEFTDVLPGTLTLVGATATSGTAATAGNTVNWDGSLAPLGGSVTITITATINAGTSGVTISNQGTVAFDADANGSNESNKLTDDPAVGGAADPTSFVVGGVIPPTILKAFGAATIPLNGSTSLTFTINNPNGIALTGLGFTDSLPAGLLVATPNGLGGTCTGTKSAVAGSGSVSLSGATLAAGTPCTVSVNVIGATVGVKNNVTGTVSATESGAGLTASASINVIAPPAITKAFGAANILINGTTSLTITLTNPAGNTVSLTGVAFTDSLPAGLVVATPNALVNTCGGTATATAGSGSVSLATATIAVSSSCIVTVNVTGTTAGNKVNVTGAVTSTNGGTGSTATASVSVGGAAPTIAKAFGAVSIGLNASTSLTFTITNPNAIALTGVTFTDNLPAGLVVSTPNALSNTCGGTATAVAGSGTVSLSAGTLAASGSCTLNVNVTATTLGAKPNTTGAISSTETGTGASSNTATLNVVQLTFSGPTATGTGTATASITTSGGGPSCGFTFAAFVPLSAVPAAQPDRTDFPQGLFDFTVANCTPGFSLTLTVTYPQAIPDNSQYWKYGPTSGNPVAHWYVMPSTISGNTATLTITDGGLGDDDLAANGSITDQGGPGVPLPPPVIPTMQQGILALLSLLFLFMGIVVIRRRTD